MMILSRMHLAVQFAIAFGLGASAGAEKASQTFLRRKDVYISVGSDEAKVKVSKEGDLAYHHGIQLENDRVSNKETPHANSRHLQAPRHPELSVKPNGNKIDASATFYQGGQQSIKIFAGDCSTASPIQFTIGEINPTNSYTYTAPANPATSIVDFEISLVGISFVRGLDNGDVVLCVELETANTLRHTLVRVDLDLYGAYSFGLYGEEQNADAAAVEESTSKRPVESKSSSRWRIGSEFRSKILNWWRSSSSSSNRKRAPLPDR